MPVILRSPVWSDPRLKPPFRAAEIDWSHPLARRLLRVWLLNEGGGTRANELVYGRHGTFVNNPVWAATSQGIMVRFDRNPYIDCGSFADLNLTRPFSLWVLFRRTDNVNSWCAIIGKRQGSYGYSVVCSSSGNTNPTQGSGRIWMTNDTTYLASPAQTVPDNSGFHTVLASWSISGRSLFVDGVRVAADTNTENPGVVTSSLALGREQEGDTVALMGGEISAAYIFLDALDGYAAAWLHAEPYAFLRPVIRRRWFVPPGGQTIPVGQALESDVAQAVARRKTRTVGQVLETDLAQPVGRIKALALVQATESDLAQPIARLKTRLVARVIESDLAQPVTRSGQTIAVGRALETDIAQAVGPLKIRSVARVLETDFAQVVARAKTRLAGQAFEVDAAQVVTWAPKHRLVGQAAESDAASSVSAVGAIVPRPFLTLTPLLTRPKVPPIGQSNRQQTMRPRKRL